MGTKTAFVEGMTDKPQTRFKKRKLTLDVTRIEALPDNIPSWERELIELGFRCLLDQSEHEAPVAEASNANAI